MRRIVTAKQMKYLDERTIFHHKISSLVLMERAALSVVKHLKQFDLTKTLVVCGSGNNGGDGIAIARILHLMGKEVDVYFAGDPAHSSEGCMLQTEIAKSYGVRWINNPDYSEYTTIVDALFGVGLSRTVTGTYAETINGINSSLASVVSVDIPSGVATDSGKVLGVAVKADLTVSFAFEKVGQLLRPGKSHCGRLVVEDIGIYDTSTSFTENYWSFDKNDLKLIPIRKESGNKGTFGKVLLIAGSVNMPGASVLCGQAIMRIGAGMLKMVVPKDNKEIIACTMPEAMLAIYDSKEIAVKKIEESLSWADVVVIGPGIGTDNIAEAMVEYILHNCDLPVVLDADAINLVSKHIGWLENKKCPCILTPHVGEMARLLKIKIQDVADDLLASAKNFAERYKVQVVLKDSITCVALADNSVFINTTGNCGMATAGSGDVLTGIIGGLLAIGTKWEYAGALGTWLHGTAGDQLNKRYGSAHLMAGDLIKELALFRIGEERGVTNEEI